MEFDVTLRFQSPAWDEKDGITFYAIRAKTKAEAIKYARQDAYRDGHLPATGKGGASFSAKEL